MKPLYFNHYANAMQDEKLMTVMQDYALAGYGCYFAILELMFNNNGYLENNYKAIAYQLHCDTQFVKSIVEDYNLFTFCTADDRNTPLTPSQAQMLLIDNPQTTILFYSPKFIQDIAKCNFATDDLSKTRSENGKKGAFARWKNGKSHKNNGIEEKRIEDTPPIIPPTGVMEEPNNNQNTQDNNADDTPTTNSTNHSADVSNMPEVPTDCLQTVQALYREYKALYQYENHTTKKPTDSPALRSAIIQAAQWIQGRPDAWLLLPGKPGIGKTTLAKAILAVYAAQKHLGLTDARRAYGAELCNDYNNRERSETYNECTNCPILFIDEIGTEHITGNYNRGKPVAELLMRRYELGIPVIMATNQTPEFIFNRYGEALADRFQQRTQIIDIQITKSFRKPKH